MNSRRKNVPAAALQIGVAAALALLLAGVTARAQEVASPAKPAEATIEQIDNPQVFNLWLNP